MKSSHLLGAKLGGKRGYHRLVIKADQLYLQPHPGLIYLNLIFMLSGFLCMFMQFGDWVFDPELFRTVAYVLWALGGGMMLIFIILQRSFSMKIDLVQQTVLIKGTNYHQTLDFSLTELESVFILKEHVSDEDSGVAGGVEAHLLGFKVSSSALERWNAPRAEGVALLFHEDYAVIYDYGQRMADGLSKPFEYIDTTAQEKTQDSQEPCVDESSKIED